LQQKVTKCLGLVTQFNPLTVVPGALSKANDCMIRRENIVEDRRGNRLYATLASNVTKHMEYLNKVVVHRGTAIEYDNGSGTFNAYAGSYSAPSGRKMAFNESFSNLYFTTSLGVKVISDMVGTAARLAGAPRALDPSYALSGTTGFLANTSQCAYRSVIRRTDVNTNVMTGYPSQRLWVTNSAGASRNVDLTMYLPSDAILGDIVQFYRTIQYSGTSTDLSGDEMGLVYQYELAAADITAGYVTFTDSVTDALRGATLYTSPSQEGIGQANDRPPLAKDVTLYKAKYMLFANTQTKQRLSFSMVGTGALSSKTITLAGVTYNFGATEIISGGGSPQVKVSATGVAAVDIDLTARSLVKVINRYASNTAVYAYYLTGPDDLPGQIMIEEKGIGAAAFTLQAVDTSVSGMFFPAPPVSPATNAKSTSSNSVQKNYIYYSKSQQPEHVPLLNYLPVGSGNTEILRIVALRDSTIIIKEEGVFRLTGETPQSFTVVSVDDTVFCLAADSVSKLANQVFMLSNQGVVSISESGVEVVSHEIEPNLTPLLSVAALSDYTSGCSYESERSYFLSTITASSETAASQTLVYNIFTKTWVRHTYAFSSAIVPKKTDKMFFSKPSSPAVFVERKSFSDADFADPESTIVLTAIGAATVDFTTPVTPSIGWVIAKGTSEIPIKSLLVIAGGYRATLESSVPADWTLGSATLYPSVGMDVEWQPWTGGAAEAMKQVWLAAILGDDSLADSSATALTFKFRSNLFPEFEEQDIIQSKEVWGSAWGSSPWGGGGDPVGYPTYVPKNMQYSTRLTLGVKHKYARQKLVIAGFAVAYNMSSERIGR
jgi:hypothetical protein